MEIQWNDITLKDREIIQPYYRFEQPKDCEYSFCNNYLWGPFYGLRYAIVEDMLVFLTDEDGYSVTMPLAKDEASAGNVKQALLQLEAFFEEVGQEFHMHLVTHEKFRLLESLFPGKYQITFNRDDADYIYEVPKMISLAGKKLHGKRNHIHRFKANNPDWSYEELKKENVEECLQMAEQWKKENLCETRGEKHLEYCVTIKALNQFQELGLKGGVLWDGNRVVAFTLGEELNSQMFVVHIEKAFANVQGAYPMINQQFLEHEAYHYDFVNREEDVGEEGLRKAKLSYYPAFLQDKGVVTLKK